MVLVCFGSDSQVIQMNVHLGGSIVYRDRRFKYVGRFGVFEHVIDPDYICWGTFQSISKHHRFSGVVEQVWYKSPEEHMDVARPIILNKDDGIRMLCADAIEWGEVDIYLKHATCCDPPVLLLTWKTSDAEDVAEDEAFGDEPEAVGDEPEAVVGKDAAVIGEDVVGEDAAGIGGDEPEAVVGDEESVAQNQEPFGEEEYDEGYDEGEEEDEEREEEEEEEEEGEEEEEQGEAQGEEQLQEGAIPENVDAGMDDPIAMEEMGEAEFASIFEDVHEQTEADVVHEPEEAQTNDPDVESEDEFERQCVDADIPEHVVDTDDE